MKALLVFSLFLPLIASADQTFSDFFIPTDSLNSSSASPIKAPPSGSVFYEIQGTAGDSVDYLLLYTATDNTCGTATAAPTVTEISQGTHLDVGLTYRVSTAGVTSFLGGSPADGPHYIGLYAVGSGLNCAGAHCSNGYDNTDTQHLCMTATYTSGTLNSISQSDNGVINLNKPAQFLYFPDASDRSIKKCNLNSDGSISVCTVAADLSGIGATYLPTDMAFATSFGTQYAYIVDNNSTGDNDAGNVYRCGLNADGSGNLTDCAAAVTQGTFVLPRRITFATVNTEQYAYIGDDSNGDVYQCTLAFGGAFGSCSDLGATGANGASSLIIANAVDGQYLYIAGYSDNGNIYKCTVNNTTVNNITGWLSACGATGTGQTNPDGFGFLIAPNPIDPSVIDHNLYVLDHTSVFSVTNYVLQDDGGLGGGGSAKLNKFLGLTGMTFSSVSEPQYAYLSDFNSDQSGDNPAGYNGGKIWVCPADNFFGCTWTPANDPGSWQPNGNPALAYMTT